MYNVAYILHQLLNNPHGIRNYKAEKYKDIKSTTKNGKINYVRINFKIPSLFLNITKDYLNNIDATQR